MGYGNLEKCGVEHFFREEMICVSAKMGDRWRRVDRVTGGIRLRFVSVCFPLFLRRPPWGIWYHPFSFVVRKRLFCKRTAPFHQHFRNFSKKGKTGARRSHVRITRASENMRKKYPRY